MASRSLSRMLCIVLSAAVTTTALIGWAIRNGWTDQGDTEFEAANGALIGIAIMVIPATLVGIFVAFGPGRLDFRIAWGVLLLGAFPLLALVALTMPKLLRDDDNHELRNQRGLFAAFAALVTGLGIFTVWSMVGLFRTSPLVPADAASQIASLACVFILVPCAVLVLLLTRRNAAAYSRWLESAQKTDSTQQNAVPTLAIGLALVTVYVACIALLVPGLRVFAVGWHIARDTHESADWHADRAMTKHGDSAIPSIRWMLAYCFQWPFRDASRLSLACAGTALVLILSPGPSVLRFGLFILLFLTPTTIAISAIAVARREPTDRILTRGSWQFLIPVTGVALTMLRAALTRREQRLWWMSASAATFGAAAVGAVVLFIVAPLQKQSNSRRFEVACRVIAVCVLPWWLFTLVAAGLTKHMMESMLLSVPPMLFATLTMGSALLDCNHGHGIWVLSVLHKCFVPDRVLLQKKISSESPGRVDIIWICPHALLIVSIVYLSLNAVMIPLRVGGTGIILATTAFAPFATYGGINLVRSERNKAQWWQTPDFLFVAPFPCFLLILFFVHVVFYRNVAGFLHFEAGWHAELRAASIWLAFMAPASVVAWRLVHFATSAWSTGAPSRTLQLTKAQRGYYSRLIEQHYRHSLVRRDNPRNMPVEQSNTGSTTPKMSLVSILQDGMNLSTIRSDEALPVFTSILCLMILVPFGVVAPLAFIARTRALGLTQRSIMAYLGVAVITGIGTVTFLANQSLERMKREKQSKLAAFELRLALRKRRIIASTHIARLLHETREAHGKYITQLAQKQGRDLFSALADTVCAALSDDLNRAEGRVARATEIKNREYERRKQAIHTDDNLQTHSNGRKLDDVKAISHANLETTDEPTRLGMSESQFPETISFPDVEDDCDYDECGNDIVFWKACRQEAGFMELTTASEILSEVQLQQDRELDNLAKEVRRRNMKTTGATSPTKTSEDAEGETLGSLIPTWLVLKPKDSSAPTRKTYPSSFFRRILESVTSKAKDQQADHIFVEVKSTSTLKNGDRTKGKVPKLLHVAPRNLGEADEPAVAQTMSRLTNFYQRMRVQTTCTTLDDDDFHITNIMAAKHRVDWLNRKTLACIRWRTLLELSHALADRAWVLQPASKETTLMYRQAMLPRAFCRYTSLPSGASETDRMGLNDWLRFLDDAKILKGDTHYPSSKHALSLDNAKRIFRKLQEHTVNVNMVPVLSYASFRHAMRETAVLLYPHISESDALKLLGQKHVFPNVHLVPAKVALERGLLLDIEQKGDVKMSPRLSDYLARKVTCKSQSDMTALRQAYSSSKHRSYLRKHFQEGRLQSSLATAQDAGMKFAERLQELRDCVSATEVAIDAIIGGKNETERRLTLSTEKVAQILSGTCRDDSPEARELAELECKAAEEELRDEAQRRGLVSGCGFARLRGLFTLSEPQATPGEAQMELALLKAGVETLSSNDLQPSNWKDVVDVVCASLRSSADECNRQAIPNFVSSELHQSLQNRRKVHVTFNSDNAFAVFELLTESASFGTLAFQGAGAYGLGIVRSCELDATCPNDAKLPTSNRDLVSFITRIPLFTFNFNVVAQFWFVCIFSLFVPLYLLKAVKAAREQRIGLAADGSTLKVFTTGWFYFNSIKVLQLAMPPVMTTLVSVLVCDTCEPQPRKLSRMSTKCASLAHVGQMVAALIATISFYPAMAYIQVRFVHHSQI